MQRKHIWTRKNKRIRPKVGMLAGATLLYRAKGLRLWLLADGTELCVSTKRVPNQGR